MVLPAGLAVRKLENDHGGDGVDGQIVLHSGEVEEALVDAPPDVWQLVVVDTVNTMMLREVKGARARD